MTFGTTLVIIAFPLQQSLHKSSLMLRYTYIACFVFHLKRPFCPLLLLNFAPLWNLQPETAVPLPNPAVATPLILHNRGFIPSLLRLQTCFDVPRDLWDAPTF